MLDADWATSPTHVIMKLRKKPYLHLPVSMMTIPTNIHTSFIKNITLLFFIFHNPEEKSIIQLTRTHAFILYLS